MINLFRLIFLLSLKLGRGEQSNHNVGGMKRQSGGGRAGCDNDE